MTYNITNKDYITITDTKVMVGGKKTKQYHGNRIFGVDYLPDTFKDIQAIVEQEYGFKPIEMHVLSSETPGNYAKFGNPSSKEGNNTWLRFLFANGVKTPWVFGFAYSMLSDCAYYCAFNCAYDVRRNSGFRSGVFGSVADAIKKDNNRQTKSRKIGRVIKSDATKIQSSKVGQVIEMDFGNSIMQLKIIGIKEESK